MREPCAVCRQPHRYRCPKCRAKYCSAPCFTAHDCHFAAPTRFVQTILAQFPFEQEEHVLSQSQLAMVDKGKLRERINQSLLARLKAVDQHPNRLKKLADVLEEDQEVKQWLVDCLAQMGLLDQTCRLK